MELLNKVRYRSLRTPEPLQNAASGGVRERGKRGIEVGLLMLNHVVQYIKPDRRYASGGQSAEITASGEVADGERG